MAHRVQRFVVLTAVAALTLRVGVVSAAPTVSTAPDVTVTLDGTIVTDDQVAIDDRAGGIAIESFLGGLPSGAEVDAYHDDLANGVLFSVDTRVALPGGVIAGDEDVVRMNGGTFSLVFDGSALGVPAGVGVDGVTRAIRTRTWFSRSLRP